MPNRLLYRAEFTLYTQIAYDFITGSAKRYGSLRYFIQKTKHIYSAAKRDDPYADQCLLGMEAALLTSQITLDILDKEVVSCMATYEKLSLVTIPPHAHKASVTSSSPYGYLAGRLIQQLDNVISNIVMVRRVALMEIKRSHALITEAVFATRHVLLSPSAWQYTGVTRHDVLNNTPKAQAAKVLMKALDARVLQQQLRATYAPLIPSKKV